MAIRESDCQNWNDATSIQQYNQLKGVHTSDLDLSYQKSGPGRVLDDAIFQGIYSPEVGLNKQSCYKKYFCNMLDFCNANVICNF
jgi:hypothetical protein